MRKTIIFITTLLCFKVMPVYAASFDCSKASTDVEKMICADEELSWLDDLLAQKYKKALHDAQDKDVLKKTQFSWLRGRNYCEDNECIKEQLNSRINVLKIVLSEPLTYEAITKLPAGKDENGNEVFEQRPHVDETDIKACQAITDNINEMEKYHIDWECGFPISSNNYLLSKPQWTEIAGEEKIQALASNNQKEDSRPVFGFLYNVGSKVGDIKIYSRPLRPKSWVCMGGNDETRNSLWLADKDGSSLKNRLSKSFSLEVLNHEVVKFSSRVYTVEYLEKPDNKISFFVSAIKDYTGEPNLKGGCVINPTNHSISSKE